MAYTISALIYPLAHPEAQYWDHIHPIVLAGGLM
jgi:hypothetical protein